LFGGFGQERAITSGKRSAGLPAGEAQILTNVGAVWFVLGQNKQTNSKASATKAAWNCSAFIGKTGQEPTWFFFLHKFDAQSTAKEVHSARPIYDLYNQSRPCKSKKKRPCKHLDLYMYYLWLLRLYTRRSG
jgi:hypothetical protein